MSRRRGEFEHRTSIFEGAFRAWSHLGGLDPVDLESKQTSELDPLSHPIHDDPRIAAQKKKKRPNSEPGSGAADDGSNATGAAKAPEDPKRSSRREFPYEPLPRSGLAHPFVQAILSPWLGPDADQDAIQLGLTTLRTWWQHRRKGESGSAIVALGTEKMTGVVDGYTRHFFSLAHCLVVNDKEQPPRTLQGKMKDLEKSSRGGGKGGSKKRKKDDMMAPRGSFGGGMPMGMGGMNMGGNQMGIGGMGMGGMSMGGGMNGGMGGQMGLGPMGGGMPGGMMQPQQPQQHPQHHQQGPPPNGVDGMTPLERLHAAQRRQLAESGGVHSSLPNNGGIDLPPSQAPASLPQFDVRGKCVPGRVDIPGLVQQVSSAATQLAHRGLSSGSGPAPPSASADPSKYGDVNVTPVVVCRPGDAGTGRGGRTAGDVLMDIEGITCSHCVKIVEAVLMGCNGSRSPIDGLVDAVADQDLMVLLIRIDDVRECRRIAFESARNLSMVGYKAEARSVDVTRLGNGADTTLEDVYRLFERAVPAVRNERGFDWSRECRCPDIKVLPQDCPRRSQMSQGIIELFKKTAALTSDFVSGKSVPPPADAVTSGPPQGQGGMTAEQQQAEMQARMVAEAQQRHLAQLGMPQAQQQQQQQGQGGVPLLAEPVAQPQRQGGGLSTSYQQPIQDAQGDAGGDGNPGGGGGGRRQRMSLRMSGLAALGRHMSMTSETTFGRAMSGLSALSIDWENMDDFDVNVDHSAGINNDVIQRQQKERDGASGGQSQPAEAARDGPRQQQAAQGGTSPGGSQGGEPTQAELQAILAAGAAMGGGGMGPRSSMRRPNVGGGGGGQMSQQQQQAYNVSFANGM